MHFCIFLVLPLHCHQPLTCGIQGQVARNLGKTLRAFQPTIKELQVS